MPSDAELFAVAVLGMPVGLIVYVVLAMFGNLRWSIGMATLWCVFGALGGVAMWIILVWEYQCSFLDPLRWVCDLF